MQSLIISWTNCTRVAGNPIDLAHADSKTPAFTPSNLTQHSSMLVDRSANLGQNLVGSYI